MTDKIGLDGRVFRSAAKKLLIASDGEADGWVVAGARHGVNPGNIQRWSQQRKKLEKIAAREAKTSGKSEKVNGTHVRVTDANGNGNGNGHETASAITGLGAMITEIRAVVVKELATELTPIIEGIIDQRMGEIVSREIRRALEAKPG